MELRSGNNALQLILAQKDELIEKLTQEKIELKNSLSLNQGEEVVRLEAMNAELKKEYAQALKQIEQLNKKMAEMRNEMQMAPPVETMEDVSEREAKLLAEVQKLLDQKTKLQQMYDSVNEMNKALRHKAGQVFISALGGGIKLGSGVAKGNEKANLEDEEAVVRMLKKIDEQKTFHGDLLTRLKKSGYQGLLNQK